MFQEEKFFWKWQNCQKFRTFLKLFGWNGLKFGVSECWIEEMFTRLSDRSAVFWSKFAENIEVFSINKMLSILISRTEIGSCLVFLSTHIEIEFWFKVYSAEIALILKYTD